MDSVKQVTVIANHILLDKNKNSFLATRKPVMIFYRDNDSTYLAADTLFSGLRKYDTAVSKTVLVSDTAKNTVKINVGAVNDSIRYFLGFRNVRIFNDSLQAVCDSLYYSCLLYTSRCV